MAGMQRAHRFSDQTKLVNSHVEHEIQNIVDTWNSHNSGSMAWTTQVWKASDNRYFKISIGYLPDGVTPTLVFQEVTYP